MKRFDWPVGNPRRSWHGRARTLAHQLVPLAPDVRRSESGIRGGVEVFGPLGVPLQLRPEGLKTSGLQRTYHTSQGSRHEQTTRHRQHGKTSDLILQEIKSHLKDSELKTLDL